MRAVSLSRVVLVASLVATACGFSLGLGDGPRRRQCDALVERVAQTALPATPELALRFDAEQLHIDKWHPHSGPICYFAGLVPQGWTALERSEEDRSLAWSAPDGGATLSYALLGASGPRERWIEGHELAPARARGLVQREISSVAADGGEHRRLLVTLADGTLWLRVIRWSTRDDGHFYFRCEASLEPAYAAALPLFEDVCDAVRVRHFEYPPW
jgi:hypothetical protein